MENTSRARLVPFFAIALLGAIVAVAIMMSWREDVSDIGDTGVNDDTVTMANSPDFQSGINKRVQREFPSSKQRVLPTKGAQDDLPRIGIEPQARKEGQEDVTRTILREDVSRETVESVLQERPKIGPLAWMPQVSPEEEEAIADTLNKPMPPATVWLEARRQSIDMFKTHSVTCFQSLQERDSTAKGRAIVAWEIEGNGRVATAHNVRLGPVLNLEEEIFLDCLTNVTFPEWPTDAVFETVLIEYPLMLP